MKKTISYKLGFPPAGVKGRNNTLPVLTTNSQAVDGKFYIPYNDPFIEARCVLLNRLGAVVALTTPKSNGSGIEYRILVAPTLLSQSWQIDPAYTKLFDATGNPELAGYIEAVSYEFNISQPQDFKSQSVYTKAAFKINESLSEAMASDTSELIDFSYKVDYDPEIMSRYITTSGTTHPTRNGEFFNSFGGINAMSCLWQSDLYQEVASRQEQTERFQKPDGSFIAFWPTDIDDMIQQAYDYDANGLSNLVADGLTTLEVVRDQQREVWEEEYSFNPGPA